MVRREVVRLLFQSKLIPGRSVAGTRGGQLDVFTMMQKLAGREGNQLEKEGS